MNVSADAGALQARSNTAASILSTPKGQPGSTASTPAAQKPAGDSFQAETRKAAPMALDAPQNSGGGNPKIDPSSGNGATYQRVDGRPFIQGAGDASVVDWNDIDQGNLADCYVMSSLGEVAKANPQLIQNAIKDNGDGTYTVRFYERQGDGPFGWFGHHYDPVDIKVTPDLPMDGSGNPVFAGTADRDGAQQELWPALMEKAYAQWKGGYDAINHGGNPGDIMAAITGQDSSEKSGKDVTLDQLNQALSGGQAVTAGTFSDGKGKDLYDNGKLSTWHVYMVTGVDTSAGTVTLRNPWSPNLPDTTLSITEFNKNISYVDFNPTR